jgi:hypothetical protein
MLNNDPWNSSTGADTAPATTEASSSADENKPTEGESKNWANFDNFN